MSIGSYFVTKKVEKHCTTYIIKLIHYTNIFLNSYRVQRLWKTLFLDQMKKYFMTIWILLTSGAMRNNIRNFWHANPNDVLRSAGLGEGPLLEEHGLYVGVNGLIPLGVPPPPMGGDME